MMKRLVLVIPALACLAGCGGGGGGKPSCSAAEPCASGSYCAHTADGNVCWPDPVAPVISDATLTCSTPPCRRDATLTLAATVTDESAMGTVTAVIDGDVEHPRTLTHGPGATYTLDLPPQDLPFPYFEHSVTAVVKATDEAGNAAPDRSCDPLPVTRAKWTRQLKGAGDTAFPLFSPAVLSNGTIVVAGSDGSVHFVNKSNGEESRAAVAIGSVVNSPPAVGADAVWVAAQNGSLHKLLFSGSEVPLTDCVANSPLRGPPVILGQRAVVVSAGAEVIVAKVSNACNLSNLSASSGTPAALGPGGHLFVGSGTALHSTTVSETSVVTEDWTGVAPAPPAPSVGSLLEPLAIDSQGAIWTTALNGDVYRTTSSGVAQHIGVTPSISASSTGSIVLADGSAVVADYASVLRRISDVGSPPWTTSSGLSGHPRIPLALKGIVPMLLVPTSDGFVFAVRQGDGQVDWSQKLPVTNQSLEPANIWTDPGATTSTAYLAGADGTLYAIIVDGALDTSAPWPKAFHDPQNTSNAGVTP